MKKRLIYVAIAILLITLAFTIRLSQYYSISCEIYAENGIKGHVASDLNKIIINEFNENKVQSDEICKINRLENGYISSITVNSTKVNEIANNIAIKIYDKIQNNEYTFGVPLGNSMGINYLSGKGPKIGVTVVPVNQVEFEIHSILTEGGINQTLHKIYVDFNIKINCIAPFHTVESEINLTAVIAETFIVGEIPQIILPKY